ncbi:MAG: hypothetical protein ACRELX_05810, partial [Longimicrobiales bacterium]
MGRRPGRVGRLLLAAIALLALAAARPVVAQTADALARSAHRECGGEAPLEKIACYEAALTPVARAGDLPRALSAVEALAALDPEVRRDGHLYVHGLGIAAYDPGRDVAETFIRCSELFHAGCYHGVIQAYFAATGDATAERVNGICTRVRQRRPDTWIYFQCVHGLGHGLTILYGHDLPRGLEGCDLLTGAWERESCYGGAFMENAGNATHPHHAALMQGIDGGGEHGAHGHGGDRQAFRPIDPENPHYPCTAVGQKYREACYGMQTTVMLYLNDYNFADAARTCDGAAEDLRRTCHQSLGRDASGYVGQDPDETRNLCRLDRSPYAAWCYIGDVKAINDWTGTPDAGFSFCAAVTEDVARIRCYEAVGEQVGIMLDV